MTAVISNGDCDDLEDSVLAIAMCQVLHAFHAFFYIIIMKSLNLLFPSFKPLPEAQLPYHFLEFTG